MSITRNTNDVLHVSGGGSNNIVKFDTLGNMLGVITNPDLPAPQGIAFDDKGHFLSSSSSVHKIVEFDENDNYVQTISAGNLQVPRSIALKHLNPVTSIEDEITVAELDQNYPNPFNPTTKIKYSFLSNVKRETSNVSLKVYDILGKKVATIVNEEKSSGSCEVKFSETELPSGIYFYKLDVGNFSDTKKMILLKHRSIEMHLYHIK